MIAVFWLLLAWAAGISICRRFRITGGSDGLSGVLIGHRDGCTFQDSPWPFLFFSLAAGLWTGLLALTWLTYGLAALLAPLLPLSVHPLLVVNAFLLAAGAAWLLLPALSRLVRNLRNRTGKIEPAPLKNTWATYIRSLRQPDGRFFFMVLILWIILGCFLMNSTFSRDGTLYKAGYSVFSDFAPHTALVSSFSQGRNWPTEYPHFPNDGIAYHFMFYFLCGNLNYLGLPLDLAINLPSILGLVSFCLLLGILAMHLTGHRATFLLAPVLLFFRSSWAFFTNLGDLARLYGMAPAAWPKIIQALLRQSTYIGNTPRDDWGLWGVNVYANQRHLLPGLSIALIILFLFLPDLQEGLRTRPKCRDLLFSRAFWRIGGPTAWRRLILALILGMLLPYFHGSVLVSLVLILFFTAIFSKNRLSIVIFIASVCLSALFQSQVFAGSISHVVRPSWHFGFIAENKSIPGILLYLLEMSGLLLPLLILAFWLPGRKRKVLIGAFCLPLVLAFTVSLTPDVTVNHKYIMITFALCNIYIADLIARLYGRKRSIPHEKMPGQDIRRLAAVFLAIMLTITGVQEIIILRNINRNTVSIDAGSPLVKWIRSNTRPDAVFVSAPYHYNSFYLSGRSTWLGHSYYAWSAGHNTSTRLIMEQQLVSGFGGQLQDAVQFIESEGLDYLIIDDILREHNEFSVDEAFFDAFFPIVAEFPGLGNMKIYDLAQPEKPAHSS